MLTRVSTALITLALTAPPMHAGMLGDAPDAIACSVTGVGEIPSGRIVFYIDAQAEDGRTFYKSLGVPISLLVNAEGVVEAEKLSDCHGKSVATLREAGSAFDFR